MLCCIEGFWAAHNLFRCWLIWAKFHYIVWNICSGGTQDVKCHCKHSFQDHHARTRACSKVFYCLLSLIVFVTVVSIFIPVHLLLCTISYDNLHYRNLASAWHFLLLSAVHVVTCMVLIKQYLRPKKNALLQAGPWWTLPMEDKDMRLVFILLLLGCLYSCLYAPSPQGSWRFDQLFIDFGWVSSPATLTYGW